MRIESAGPQPVRTEKTEQLKNVEAGDVIKGKVTEATANTVTIRTPGGQVLTASLPAGMEIRKGTLVELLVNRVTEGTVFAEVRSKGAKAPDLEAKVQALLMRLNLPVNEKNMEAAKLLIKYNLPVDSKSLSELINLSRNVENLKQADVSGKLGLLFSGIDLPNAPVEVLNKVVLLSEPEIKKTSEAQPDVKESAVDTEQEKPAAESPIVRAQTVRSQEEAEETDPVVKLLQKLMESEKRIDPQGTEQLQPKTEGDKAKAAGVKLDDQAALPDIKAKTMTAEQVEEGSSFERQALGLLKKLGVNAGQDIEQLIGKAVKVLNTVSQSNMEKLAFLLSKDLEITPKNLEQLTKNLNDTDKLSEFLQKLQQQVESENNLELKEIKEDIRRIFLKPGQVEQKEDVQAQLKDILRLGEKIERLLERQGTQNPEIRETLSGLKDNIDFIRHINQYNNYLQIPVMMNDNAATAKLYVFKEGKRNKKVDPQNATILIALDLKHIGRIESLVSIHQKNVSVTFRTGDRKTGNLIDHQTGMLREALNAKGYTLSPVKVIQLEQSFNLISLEEVISEQSQDKMHIDMRV